MPLDHYDSLPCLEVGRAFVAVPGVVFFVPFFLNQVSWQGACTAKESSEALTTFFSVVILIFSSWF